MVTEEAAARLSDTLYDLIYAGRPDVPFYLEMARRYPGPILEAACGTGRVLLPLARAGHEIHGFDLCRPRLEICEAKLAAEPEAVRARATVSLGDMLDFRLDRQFGLITTPFRGFQDLLTPDEQRAALLSLGRHLSPDGRLILDIFNPSIPFLAVPAPTEEFDQEVLAQSDGSRVRLSYRVLRRDYFAQLQEVEEIISVDHAGGRKERQTRSFTTRYTFRWEIEYLLNLAGLEVEHIFGDYDLSPFGTRYPGELIVVARRVNP